MGTADMVTKEYMRENAVFADAFNYLIYNGKKVIDPAKLKEIDPTEIALPFGDEEKAGEDKKGKVQETEWQYPGLVYLDQDHDMNGSCNNTYMGANVQAIAVCSNWKPRY